MKKLKYLFECLDGSWLLNINNNDLVDYKIETNINYLDSKDGKLNKEESKRFIELLSLANINNWDFEYESKEIEDEIIWTLEIDGLKVVGHETNEPYGYEYLIEAIKLIEDKADLFKAEV